MTSADSHKPDAFDKFFGFTESIVCSAGNRTDVEIDPFLLRDGDGMACCHGHDDATLEELHLEQNSSSDTPVEADKVSKQDSSDSGNTADETVDEAKQETPLAHSSVKKTKTARPGLWSCCRGNFVVNSVVPPVQSIVEEC